MIRCWPWRVWRGEIDSLPVSSQTLFANEGLPIDILERELKGENWLFEDEILLEVLKDESNLKRTLSYDDARFGLMPQYWTQEDYDYHSKKQEDEAPF